MWVCTAVVHVRCSRLCRWQMADGRIDFEGEARMCVMRVVYVVYGGRCRMLQCGGVWLCSCSGSALLCSALLCCALLLSFLCSCLADRSETQTPKRCLDVAPQ